MEEVASTLQQRNALAKHFVAESRLMQEELGSSRAEATLEANRAREAIVELIAYGEASSQGTFR